MFRRALLAGILSVLFASVGTAADVNGRWEGNLSGPNGDIQLTFTFKVDGTKLTGTVETPQGDVNIDDGGKAEGDHISFKTHFDANVINHEGTVSGDSIKLTVDGPWGKSEMTLKRAAEKKDFQRIGASRATAGSE